MWRTDVAFDYDVVVVGAGPAGSCAAHDLARSGARVVLLERQPLPRYKTCGGGLVGRAMRALPFDVAPVVERECSAARISVRSAHFHHTCVRTTPVVSMVMRDRFDAFLVSNAVEAGAELAHPCRVTEVEHTAQGVSVSSGLGRLQARFLIAADGATGATARAAGWRTNPRSIPAIESEVTTNEPNWNSDEVRFDIHFVPRGYAWVFPKEHHRSIGVLTTQRGRSALTQSLDAYLGECLLAPDQEDRHGYVIPVRPRSRVLARQRTLLVGDAAGLADPITAEGISFAIRSGQLAARAIVEGGWVPASVRRRYHALLDATILRELRIARVFARALYDFPRIGRHFTQQHGREFAELLVDVMSGETTFTTLASRSGFRSLLRAVSPITGRRPLAELDSLRQG